MYTAIIVPMMVATPATIAMMPPTLRSRFLKPIIPESPDEPEAAVFVGFASGKVC